MAWQNLDFLTLNRDGDYVPLPLPESGGKVWIRIPAFAAEQAGSYQIGIFSQPDQGEQGFLDMLTRSIAPFARYISFDVAEGFPSPHLGMRIINHADTVPTYSIQPQLLIQAPSTTPHVQALWAWVEQISQNLDTLRLEAAGYDDIQALQESLEAMIQGIESGDGSIGPAGPTGPAGASAYALWINAGNLGTISEFLASLAGSPGADGAPGVAGPAGPAGAGSSAEFSHYGNTVPVAASEGDTWRELSSTGLFVEDWERVGSNWLGKQIYRSASTEHFARTAAVTINCQNTFFPGTFAARAATYGIALSGWNLQLAKMSLSARSASTINTTAIATAAETTVYSPWAVLSDSLRTRAILTPPTTPPDMFGYSWVEFRRVRA